MDDLDKKPPLRPLSQCHFEYNPLRDHPTLSYPSIIEVKKFFSRATGLTVKDFYATINGRLVSDDRIITSDETVRIVTRLVGGKGGFGSMLRAIGAQIEKTTNREACRDLSGRRLRDINEEQRLRKWLDGQSEREKEAAERKLKKLERLCAEPKVNPNIDDPVYETERQALPERVSAAVEAGWQASSSGTKRKSEEPKDIKKKKKKLWIDEDLSECSSESGDEDAKKPTSTDSGNESESISNDSKEVASASN